VNNGGWNEYEKMVMDRLENLARGQARLEEHVSGLRTEVAVQKVKAGFWGALGGAVPSGIAVLWYLITGKKE